MLADVIRLRAATVDPKLRQPKPVQTPEPRDFMEIQTKVSQR